MHLYIMSLIHVSHQPFNTPFDFVTNCYCYYIAAENKRAAGRRNVAWSPKAVQRRPVTVFFLHKIWAWKCMVGWTWNINDNVILSYPWEFVSRKKMCDGFAFSCESQHIRRSIRENVFRCWPHELELNYPYYSVRCWLTGITTPWSVLG